MTSQVYRHLGKLNSKAMNYHHTQFLYFIPCYINSKMFPITSFSISVLTFNTSILLNIG